MNKTYPSKVSWGLVIILSIVLLSSTTSIILAKQWVLLPIIIPVIAFITHLFLTTRYQIKNTILIIKSGFIVNKKIEISSIRKIVETANPMSSPALSFDRIEIFFDKFDSIIISPKDKTIFIEDLKIINSKIEVILKT